MGSRLPHTRPLPRGGATTTPVRQWATKAHWWDTAAEHRDASTQQQAKSTRDNSSLGSVFAVFPIMHSAAGDVDAR